MVGITAVALVALPTPTEFGVTEGAAALQGPVEADDAVWEPYAASQGPSFWTASRSIEGRRCGKRGATRVVDGVTYRCSGKASDLRWRRVDGPKDGSPCTKVGDRVDLAEGYLECRYIRGNALVFRKLSKDPVSPGIAASPEPIDTCRLADMRPNRGVPPGPGGTLVSEAVAYPVTSATRELPLPPTGKVTVAVLPYDFSDVPGQGSPRELLAPQLRLASRWIEQFSDGRITYEWVTVDTWIRASKPSSEYQYVTPSRGGSMPPGLPQAPFKSPQWITDDLLASLPADIDLTGSRVLFFVYPPEVHNIYDMAIKEVVVEAPQSLGHVLMFTTGRWLYESNRPMWPYMIHEFGHNHGIPGHAPWDGSPLDVMTNQHGLGLTLGTWSRITMDWQEPAEIYCTTRERVADDTITLLAIDRGSPGNAGAGTTAAVVRLSDSEALIIESRRRSAWSSGTLGWPGLPRGFYGITVTRVNTAVDRNRVEGPGAYLDYVSDDDLDHGMLRLPNIPYFDLNHLLYEGESLTVDGVRIAVIKSGDHDTIRITRG